MFILTRAGFYVMLCVTFFFFLFISFCLLCKPQGKHKKKWHSKNVQTKKYIINLLMILKWLFKCISNHFDYCSFLLLVCFKFPEDNETIRSRSASGLPGALQMHTDRHGCLSSVSIIGRLWLHSKGQCCFCDSGLQKYSYPLNIFTSCCITTKNVEIFYWDFMWSTNTK